MMGEWQKWLSAILLIAIAWLFWRNRKHVLAGADFAKSFRVMGILALILIAFVGLLIVLAKGG